MLSHPWLCNIISLCIVSLTFVPHASAKRWPDLYWNSSNSIFQEGSPLNKFLTYAANEHDAMDFVCPSLSNNSRDQTQKEFLVIYMVSEMSFLTCQLDSNSVQFLVCDNSFPSGSQKRKKVVFRQFSPTPDALVFSPGSSYYFISTSNGTLPGLYSSQRGFCFSKNMRLKIDFSLNRLVPEKENANANQMEFIIEERAEYSMNPVKDENQSGESSKNNLNLADIFQINPQYMEFVRNHAVRGGTGEIRFPTEDSRFPNVDGVNVIKKPRFVSSRSKAIKKEYPDDYLQALARSSTTSLPNMSNELFGNGVVETNEFFSLKGSEKHARRTTDVGVNAAEIPKITQFICLLSVLIFLVS